MSRLETSPDSQDNPRRFRLTVTLVWAVLTATSMVGWAAALIWLASRLAQRLFA